MRFVRKEQNASHFLFNRLRTPYQKCRCVAMTDSFINGRIRSLPPGQRVVTILWSHALCCLASPRCLAGL